jgi:hypothetical protein
LAEGRLGNLPVALKMPSAPVTTGSTRFLQLGQ